MWVVVEINSTGLTDDLGRVIGPFDTQTEAENYIIAKEIEGDAVEVETPEHL